MTEPVPRLDGVLLTRDLFFSSKVTGTAQAIGLRIEAVGNAEIVPERLEAPSTRLLLIDVDAAPADLAGLLARVERRSEVRIIAFGPHVETAKLQAARDAGCDEVMPRSRFSAELVQILKSE